MGNENVVYVGSKEKMDYVLAISTQFNNGFDEIEVKGRGRKTSKVVQVCELLKNRFLQDVTVDDIEIGTEVFTDDYGDENKVSTITIKLVRE